MEVGKRIAEGTYRPDKKAPHTHAGSIGNLCNDLIIHRFRKMAGWFEKQFEAIDICMDRLEKS
jgi:argininosuccinate lyase